MLSLIKRTLICIIIPLLGLYAFVRSPYLTDSIEWLLNRYTGIEMEIGSIGISGGVVLRGVVVRMPEGLIPILRIRVVRIYLEPISLIHGEIEGIELIGPDMTLDLTSKVHGNKGMGQPIKVNSVGVRDGILTVKTNGPRYIHIRAINLTMEREGTGGVTARGGLYVEELKTGIPVDITFDPGSINIRDGHLLVAYDDMGAVTGGRITGRLTLDVHISTGDGLRAIIDTVYEDVGFYIRGRPLGAGDGSISLSIKFSPDMGNVRFHVRGSGIHHGRRGGYDLNLSGSYDLKGREVVIETCLLSSTLYGNLKLKGHIREVLSEGMDLDLTVETDGPKTAVLEAVKRHLDTDARIHSIFLVKGRMDSPSIKGRIHIKGGYLKLRGLEAKGIIAEIPVEYKDGLIHIKGASIGMKGVEYLPRDRGYMLKGSLEMEPRLSVSVPRRTIKAHIRVDLEGGRLSTPDESVAVEGLSMNAEIDTESSYPPQEIGFTVSGMATGPEVLIRRFYGDFTNMEMDFSCMGRYSIANDSLSISHAEIGLEDIGALTLSGDISDLTGSPTLYAKLMIKGLRNDNVYDFFIRETFGESIPLLSRLEIDGMSSINLSLKTSRGLLEMDGKLYLDKVDIRDDGFSIEDIKLAMPVNISYPPASPDSMVSYGSLRIGSLSIGGIGINGLLLHPSIWRNELIFRDDILVPILGGEVVLKQVRFGKIMDGHPVLTFSSEIRDVDLSLLTKALDIQRFGGRISGNIPRVRLSHDSLTVDGEVLIRAFGGEIRLVELSVDNLFSSIPSVKTSIRFNDIDLGMVTDTFEFGKITGIMDGYVRDLVITNGEVEGFDILLETVKKRGIGQWISVKALKKISILGSGGPTSILDRGIYRLFKRYRYEKMGIRARLRNNRMVLHGVTSQDGREYIVKGGLLPPKVDVISYAQEISFKELVRRLRRIKEVR